MADDKLNQTSHAPYEHVIILHDNPTTSAKLGWKSLTLFCHNINGDGRHCLADQPLLQQKITTLQNRLARDYPNGDTHLSNVLSKLQENLELCSEGQSANSMAQRFSTKIDDMDNYDIFKTSPTHDIVAEEQLLIVGAENSQDTKTYPIITISQYNLKHIFDVARQIFVFTPAQTTNQLPIIGNLDFNNPSKIPTSSMPYFKHIPSASDFVTQACQITTRAHDGSNENEHRLAFAKNFSANKI